MVAPKEESDPRATPMMRQYLSAKERHPNDLLFFRMGDFYEMFFDDAKVAAEILGIALTARSKDRDAIPMAGVPVRAVDSYLPKLLQAGRRVAICEQVQDPRDAKGLVEREVVRVVSPGTVTDEKVIGEKSNNYLAALYPHARGPGLAWIDLSTAEFFLWEDSSDESVFTELSRIEPSECVLPESVSRTLETEPRLKNAIGGAFLTTVPDWAFDEDTARRTLTSHFRTRTLEGFGCEHLTRGVCAAGGLLHYLEETQKTALSHITRLRAFPGSDFMLLDRATRDALEITRTVREGQASGSLLRALDRTVTALGARRLREWILKPLRGLAAIHARQGAVQELVDSEERREDLVEALRCVHDIERICSRMSYGSANARDLVALRDSLEALPAIATALDGLDGRFLQAAREDLGDFAELRAELDRTLVDSPPLTVREGGMVRAGFDEELDSLRDLSDRGAQWMADFQRREIEATGIPTLKVGYNKVFGYYIEVTHAQSDRVPSTYVRKQTLKNCERYITPELKDFESRVLHARENAVEREYDIFCRLRERAAARIAELQAAAEAVAAIDVVTCFARLAVERGYVRPSITDGLGLNIEDGRHPVLETLLEQDEFVANSTTLEAQKPIVVITGPNMSGKSTYIRQVALLTLLAHTGSFIPAGQAEIGLVDRIFTRVGAADDISRGQSTFMVEMHETANIVNNATQRSLLILDEVGRGTSTFDGISLAWAITEHLAATVGARTLFATHYHELTELALSTDRVSNCTFAVKEWNDSIVFLRKVIEGAADKSYGIHVARLAGLPAGILDRARQILANLEAQSLDLHGKPSFAPPPAGIERTDNGGPTPPDEPEAPSRTFQLDLFQDANAPLLREVKRLDLNRLTPLDALNYLAELRDRIV